jgi:AraC family transcriptional regulator
MKEPGGVIASLDCEEAPYFRIRLMEYPNSLFQPIHTHSFASVTLVLSGAIEEQRNRRTEFALPFTLIVKESGIPHSDRFGPEGCKTLQISLPDSFDLGECGIDAKRGIWHNNGGSFISPLLRLLKCTTQTSRLSASDVTFLLYEALEALPNKATMLESTPSWLSGVKELIDASNPLRPLSMARLREYADIHPVHLTRQFKRHFGCTVRAYMQYRRIRAAATFIAEGSLSLTDVAYRCGFADQAHFCRSFRAIAKLTAHDYRSLAKAVGYTGVEKTINQQTL